MLIRILEITVNSLNDDIKTLVSKLNASVFNDETYPSNVIFIEGQKCSFMDFDTRYWSKYENETGLDVGLLEGSNLR